MSNQIPEPQTDKQEKEHKEALSDNARLEPSGDQSVAWKYNPEYHELADFLGVKQADKMNESLAQKISFLKDYVKSDDMTDVKIRMLELKRTIGMTAQGKTLIDALYQYVRLLNDKTKIDKEISLIQTQYGQ